VRGQECQKYISELLGIGLQYIYRYTHHTNTHTQCR